MYCGCQFETDKLLTQLATNQCLKTVCQLIVLLMVMMEYVHKSIPTVYGDSVK